MKKNTAYTIGSLIILLISAFCFIVLPAFTGTEQRQEELPAFGKYNGKEIKYAQGSDFSDYVTQYAQMYQSYGQQIDSSNYFYIFSQAFDTTVMQYAYTDEVKKSGYVLPQASINRALLPYFSDANGKYDAKLYRQTPDAQKEELNASLKKRLIASRFYDDNFGSTESFIGANALFGAKSSSKELDFLQKYDAERRGFSIALFNLNDYPEDEYVNYGKQNSAKFNKYNLSVITVEDKATADKVAKRLANEELTFEDAVSEYSTKSYTNTEGVITNGYQYQLENMLENADELSKITGLSKDAVSEVIQTKTGYSIFKCTDNFVAPDFDSSDVVSAVTTYVTTYENTVVEDYFIAKAKDFTTEAMKSDFETACEKFNAKKVEIPAFPLNYGNVSLFGTLDTSIDGLSGADTNENFLKAAFSLKMNEMSAPVVLSNNVAVLQYTKAEANSDETIFDADVYAGYDENSAQSAILASDKLENNFISVYFDNMMR